MSLSAKILLLCCFCHLSPFFNMSSVHGFQMISLTLLTCCVCVCVLFLMVMDAEGVRRRWLCWHCATGENLLKPEPLQYVILESNLLLLKITGPLISAPSDKLPENNTLDIHLTGDRGGVERTVLL